MLNGQERTIKLDYNALCSFEQVTGKSFLKFADDLEKQGLLSMQLSDLRALLWAGLLHEDEKLKITDVGNLLKFDDAEHIQKILSAIVDAINEAFPKGSQATFDKKKVNETEI